MAEREEDIKNAQGISGTPAYMSPEQSRGESHLVDGRSDIYSLGVVLFELLTGEMPHDGDGLIELLVNIATKPPRSLKELDRTIPNELERIVMKCLAKRANDRYQTASDLASDLRAWLSPGDSHERKPTKTLRILPKGLRSYDASDSEYYLSLLPGPRDRNGLPEGLRFWRNRIEETDPAKTFRVGVIYGPSGCGKSSYVKAGLLPRLSSRIRVVYVEASPNETTNRLIRGLERACPDVPKNGTLRDGLAHLRRMGDSRRKALLVIDQFEQWLHSPNGRAENSELADALRQCDGERVQCLLMVRDDYWLGLNRFMQKLEIDLKERVNAGLIDLFDETHARSVLESFGRAYESLPATESLAPEHAKFLHEAVSSLSEDGKVISVRLSLFAEMMRGRKWDSATLKEVGGADGLGATFLEETFDSRTSPAKHRRHEAGAKRVLRSLLPEAGSAIKGHKRSREELRQISESPNIGGEFDELMSILDGELRLITPTNADNAEDEQSYYQLTHDYLVPSLREWLGRKQKETARGRAEIILEERAAAWNSRPENRRLPNWPEWLKIRLRVPRRRWTATQAKMMSRANRYHLSRLFASLLIGIVFLLGTGTIWRRYVEERDRSKTEYLVELLLRTETSRAPELIRELSDYRVYAIPLLTRRADQFPEKSRERLHSALAILDSQSSELDYVYSRLLTAEAAEFPVIRDSLERYRHDLADKMWDNLAATRTDPLERLRLAAALGSYFPEDARWVDLANPVVELLLSQNEYVRRTWADFLGVAGKWMIPSLKKQVFDEKRTLESREATARLFVVCSKAHPGALDELEQDLAETSTAESNHPSLSNLQKRQASSAALLVMSGRSRFLDLLSHSSDPTRRTMLMDRLANWIEGTGHLLTRLDREQDDSIRRAIIQTIAEMSQSKLSDFEKKRIVDQMLGAYLEDPDAGVHASIRMLLNRCGEAKRRSQIDDELAKVRSRNKGNWFVNPSGLTFVSISKLGVVMIGDRQNRRRVLVDRSFAISTTEVAGLHFRKFYEERLARTQSKTKVMHLGPDDPTGRIQWFEAAAFCNWLSEREGLPPNQWCYLPNSEGKYEQGMRIKADFATLKGYRLPTEAEWEYACRALGQTEFSFGRLSESLKNYGWYDANAKTVNFNKIGSLRPNDFGLFDMHGNMAEWCQDIADDYRPTTWKAEVFFDTQFVRDFPVSNKTRFVVRGGNVFDDPPSLRSSSRSVSQADQGQIEIGFRIVKTIDP